jgi:hypothetical protein
VNNKEIELGAIVVVRYGVSYGWGRVVAFDPLDEANVLVSWDTIGLKIHPASSLQVIDITDDLSREYIQLLYGPTI